LFDEYNQAKDGNMTRKEFFTFLWELKQTAKQPLNEGQMMSCWMAVSKRKDSISLEEFKMGVEICYENQFFALENGAPVPVSIVAQDDPKAYNTLKFKSSPGVAAFDKILAEEKKTTPARPSITSRSTATTSSISHTRSTDPSASPPVIAKPTGLKKDAPPIPINNFSVKINQLQKEREVKKVESQKKMDNILANRYQEQRKQRELERQQQEEARNRQREAEATAMVAEPPWMQALKTKKKY